MVLNVDWIKKTEKNETQSGKLRVAGSASALDYVYLNVKNLDEAEEGTITKNMHF